MQTVLGIDLGTQQLKVVLYDFVAHRVAAVAAAPLNLHRADFGVAEQQARWWIEALQSALAKVDPAIRDSVRAIGVSGQQHGFVAIDRSG